MFPYVDVQLGRQRDILEDREIYMKRFREILGKIERYLGRYRDTQRDREIDIKTDSYVLFHQMGFNKEAVLSYRQIRQSTDLFHYVHNKIIDEQQDFF
jgi:hypothetical protein